MNNTRLKAIKEAKGYHILPIKAGQLIEIHETVGNEGNLRTWRFKGMVLKVKKPNHPDGTFTIRGKIAGMTIEKIYPLSFDKFEKVILLDEFKTRRARLYYLRDKVGKAARMATIAAADEKGVDLLVLAKESAKSAHEDWKKANAPAEKTEKTQETAKDEKVEKEDTPASDEATETKEQKEEATSPEDTKKQEADEKQTEDTADTPETKEETTDEQSAAEEKKEDTASEDKAKEQKEDKEEPKEDEATNDKEDTEEKKS